MRFPRLRFGLRTLLVLFVLVAIPSAWLGKHWLRVRVERPIVAKIRANGGDVYYDYQRDGKNFVSDKTPPGWKPLRSMLGDDFFAAVIVATYGHKPPTQIIDIEFDQLSELEQLSINCENLPEESITKLVSLKKLDNLTLNHLKIRPETFRQLAECKALTFLSINGDQVTKEHLQQLKHFSNLTWLQVMNTPLTDDGLLAVCELRGLKTLDLLWSNGFRSMPLTSHGFQGLAQLQELESFKLSGPANAATAALAKLPNLRSVQLYNDSLKDAGLLQLSSLTKLVEFKSESIQLSDASMPAFRKMLRLQWLKLEGPFITDKGLALLSRLTNLNHLELKNAQLTDQGLQQLTDLSKLEELTITLSNSLTKEGVRQLSVHLPNCKFFDRQNYTTTEIR